MGNEELIKAGVTRIFDDSILGDEARRYDDNS